MILAGDDVLVGADDFDEWTGRDWSKLLEDLAATAQIMSEREGDLVLIKTYLLVS
jgi:hypothetical protein